MGSKPSTSIDWLKRRTLLVFGVVVFGYLLVGSVKLVYENYRVQHQSSQLRAEVENLRQYNGQLKDLLAYYKTDAYRDKEARLRLNFAKPGERVVAVPLRPGDDTATITEPGIETRSPTPPANPRQWWEYFFGPRA